MNSGSKLNFRLKIFVGLGILLQTLLVVYMQFRFAFMLEDMDYLMNLATGEPLKGLGDIIKGIPSILKGDGGSVLSIVVLQVILLMGQHAADIINVLVMALISFLVYKAAGAKRGDIVYFALPFFMLFAFNNDWQFSYMWQFGIVNFVYPAVPFMLYLVFVLKELDGGKKKLSTAQQFLGCVSAFFAAWANASYGFVCLCIFLVSVLLIVKVVKRKMPTWLIASMVFIYLGMALFLLAPGNFSENSVIRGSYITFSIFPGVVLSLALLAVMLRCNGFLTLGQMMLIVALGFSVLLRFIVGWIPVIYENGIQVCTLVLSITVVCNLLKHFSKEHPEHYYWSYIIAACSFIYSVCLLLENVGGVN